MSRSIDFITCEYPGVTSVINDVFNTSFDHIPAETLKQSQIRGTAVHEFIEETLKGNEPLMHFEYWSYRDAFHKWMEQFESIEPLYLEKEMIDDEIKVKGIADFIGYLDGELYVIDWKTSSNMSGDTLLSATLQSLIYKDMVKRLLDLDAKTRVVSIQRDKFTDIEVEDSDMGQKIVELYHFKKKFVKRRKPVLYDIVKDDVVFREDVTKREANKILKHEEYRGRVGYELVRK